MNNKHILDLTLRLSQALDQNYDVVSMDTVLSVISALEGTTITKEQLEATRLAKYINQLRRRTKCENLARRAKSLLKKWREMVGIQQSNETTVAGAAATTSSVGTQPAAIALNLSTAAAAPYNMPVSDDTVSTSHLNSSQLTIQQFYRQCQSNVKQQQILHQPYHSQPTSPVNLQEKSNPNEFLISMSNPATNTQQPKSSSTNVRKKKRIEKNELISQQLQQQQQPTSFANLITGLNSTFGSSSRKMSRDKYEAFPTSAKPVETFIIEHSSNSNSDLICLPTNNTGNSNFTSATDVPPVVIDLQDTNSSMNSLVSKDITNTSSTFFRNKAPSKKSKKEKKRKERSVAPRQNQPLQDCDDQNTTTASFNHKRPSSDVLLLDEKSNSACPTISNISEILSLSNSSMSSVFPSADAMSKNVFQSGQSEVVSLSAKMSKSDLTFAGKFKQNSSSSSTGCNVLNYNGDSMNVNKVNSYSPNQNKFLLFGGIGSANSNDSSSNSRTSQFNVVVDAIKPETSNSRHNIEDVIAKQDINEKSMSNMSNKGNSSTDNAIAGAGASVNAATQQQQSIDLTTMDYISQQPVKQPKKRGRKKGSKGVDSVIAKETSLSSQMFISSLSAAGKKVKTTKELYAEMENRKLRNVKLTGLADSAGNSSANWTAQQQQQLQNQQKLANSRRASFCSDDAESDSCSMTSEPSRDSGNILSKSIGKRETILDNNSNYSKNDSELKMGNVKGEGEFSLPSTDPNSALAITTKIKLKIQEILKLLTPPPSTNEIEYECFKSITPCTCTVEEVTAPADNECKEIFAGDNKSIDLDIDATTNSTNVNKSEFNHLKIEPIENISDSVQRAEKDQKDVLLQPTPPAKVKKSIFDLDFDEDEDPLNSIIADIVGKNSKAETDTIKSSSSVPVAHIKTELPLSTEDELGDVDHQIAPYALNVPTSSEDNIFFPSYEIKFDPDCKAKNRFDIQTQKITKFHIDTLHNCFIPNVNGNWNHADANNPPLKPKKNDEDRQNKTAFIIDGYDVVPFYGSDVSEQIVKDLSHVKFTKNFKVKHSKCQNKNEIFFHIPFLGVSRIPDIADCNQFYRKDIDRIKLEEEKENVDNKLNGNASALETDDAKEVGIESVKYGVKTKKYVKKSLGFKRTKSQRSLMKQSTSKRLKLAVNGKLETYTSDSSGYVENYKKHRSLFYHEEICPVVENGYHVLKESIFHISSCSSGCSSSSNSSSDEEESNENTMKCRKRTTSTSSSTLSFSSSKFRLVNSQQEIIQAEISKRAALAVNDSKKCEIKVSDCEEVENNGKLKEKCLNNSENIDDDDNDSNNLPEENNRMLLSFNNIYNKSSRDESAEQQQNKDHENNMLKQQLQNCDDYNNLNNNFNLIKYIDNKTSSVNNITLNNNNNNNSCSNNYSDTNINISSSSCTIENPTNSALVHNHLNDYIKHNNDNDSDDVKIMPFEEYQTGIRAVDEDVNDDEGNNCGRLQQFKEWHEVLQLRSYNDELLTVLPYVVLE